MLTPEWGPDTPRGSNLLEALYNLYHSLYKMELRKKIMNFLGSNDRPATTLEIARAVGMTTRKEINPTLYQMQDSRMIEKVQEQPPLWKVCRGNSNSAALIISNRQAPARRRSGTRD